VTQIDFYTHVPDKLPIALQLAGKAWEQGMKVWIRAANDTAAAHIDEALWTHNAHSFIPHCRAEHPLAAETPVIIDADSCAPHTDEVLINLHPERPEYFSRFKRLIEIVSLDDADRARARERFIFYRDRGFEIRLHDLSKKT